MTSIDIHDLNCLVGVGGISQWRAEWDGSRFELIFDRHPTNWYFKGDDLGALVSDAVLLVGLWNERTRIVTAIRFMDEVIRARTNPYLTDLPALEGRGELVERWREIDAVIGPEYTQCPGFPKDEESSGSWARTEEGFTCQLPEDEESAA